MSSPPNASELLAAAQQAGWHHNELGRQILGELTRRDSLGARPKTIILCLASSLAISLACLGLVYAEKSRLEEKALAGNKAGTQAEQTAVKRIAAADDLAAAERARAEDAVKHQQQMTTALAEQNAAVVKQMSGELNTAREEITRLQREVTRLQVMAEKKP